MRQACNSVGAVIKEGSQKFGLRVDWLGVEIDGGLRKLRVKKAFVEKLFVATTDIMTASGSLSKPIRQWYAILSCIIYSIWSVEGSMWRLPRQIEWMSKLARILSERNDDWQSLTVIPQDVLDDMRRLLKEIIRNKWVSPPLDLSRTSLRAVGYSDASNTALAWTFHSEKWMQLRITASVSTNDHIFERELTAMVEGQMALIETLPFLSAYTWKRGECPRIRDYASLVEGRRGFSLPSLSLSLS